LNLRFLLFIENLNNFVSGFEKLLNV
jgi:hypothetical protein